MFTSTYLKSHYSQLMAQHSDLTPLMFSTPLSSAPHLDYGMMGLISISTPPVTPPVTASESTPSSSRRSLFGLAHSPLKEIEKEATSSSLMESVIETATNSPRKQRNVSTESKASSSRNLETAEVNLNAIPIPKHEIECDIETFLVDRIKNFFSKTGTSLKSYYHKKFGFRQLIETKDTELYPCNPRETKRKRTIADASISSALISSASTSFASTSSASSARKLEKSADSDSPQGNSSKRFKADSDQKMEVQKEVNIFEGIPSFAVALRADRLKQIEQTNEKAKISVKYNELPYHSLMKRTFLGADDRTPKEEDRRKKNSQAALKSRAKNKIYAQKLEEEAFEAMKENFELKRKVAFLRAQVNSTLRKHGKKEVNFNELFENKVDQVLKIQPKQSELNCTESE